MTAPPGCAENRGTLCVSPQKGTAGGASPAGGMLGRGRDLRPNINVLRQWHLPLSRAYRSHPLFGNISAEIGRVAPSLTGRAGSMADPHTQSQASNLGNVLRERGSL